MPNAFVIRDELTQLYFVKGKERSEWKETTMQATKFLDKEEAAKFCSEQDRIVSYWGMFSLDNFNEQTNS